MTAGPRTLGESASRGGAVTVIGQAVRIAIMLTGVVVLARLLTTEDYGLMAMVLAIIGVGDLLRDFGLSSAAMQARTITRRQRSNLLWINTGIGLLLSGIVVAIAPLLAAFYREPRLTGIAMALAGTFLINGFMTQYKADLARGLRYARLTGIEVAGQASGLAIAIGLALGGAGYWALVAQQIGQLVVQLVLLVALTRWIPNLYTRKEPIKPFISFGANLVGVQALSYASNNVDSVVIGATVGAGPLGLYNRAYQLLVLPLYQVNAPITRVALPVLSRLQDDPKRYREFLLTGQTIMLNAVSAILAFSAAQAHAVVLVALGDAWIETASIFQILSIAGFFTMAAYACNWVFLSLGLTHQSLRMSLITRPLMIVMIVCGGFFGIYGVAWAYAIAVALQWPVALWWLGRVSDAPVGDVFRNGARTILVYGSGAVVGLLSTLWLEDASPWLALAIGAAALAAWLGLLALVWPAYRRDLVLMLSIRRFFGRARRGSAGGKGAKDAKEEGPDADAPDADPVD